jgi:hypothetical protein
MGHLWARCRVLELRSVGALEATAAFAVAAEGDVQLSPAGEMSA